MSTHDPVLSDLAAELRRDEINDAREAAIAASVALAQEMVRDAMLRSVYLLDRYGWEHSTPGIFTKGPRCVVCENDGTYSAFLNDKMIGKGYGTAQAAAEATK